MTYVRKAQRSSVGAIATAVAVRIHIGQSGLLFEIGSVSRHMRETGTILVGTRRSIATGTAKVP